MFGTRHSVVVRSAPRGYRYSCSCGATGYVHAGYDGAKQQGERHVANKTKGR